ncbi:phytoene desaturase family protein [Paenibacillus allorhizosphaerae]|uniref:Renalase n=1 Tax=Paenibacillus allorhizosphaerae TaxID=2849866 RepID=A0ABM8VUR9_9BACL|nr:NAD(P)/FAD-dependent oxidoreductase [Paenibacillus allorhizosphaerae]CAG7658996.1 Renalase [Paenibacillus allorhizosphaerae]
MKTYDVAVIGGGIAGLVAANDLARAGKTVVVLEKSAKFGGRAMTVSKNGALFNLGVHALYRGGSAEEIFLDLGLKLEGGTPLPLLSMMWGNKVIPVGKFLLSRYLSWSGRVELLGLFAKLGKVDTKSLAPVSVREWIEKQIRDPMVRNILYAFIRASSYTQAPDRQCIGPVLDQVQRSLKKKGVVYVRGGWQSIVDQLHEKAVCAGVTMESNKRVAEIRHDGIVRSLQFTDGETMNVEHVISALPVEETHRLVRDVERTALLCWKDQARNSVAACLDLCLKQLPSPKCNVVLGIDQPIFFTNQSKVTKLSEDGTSVVHIIKHNETGGTDSRKDEAYLEHMMDLIQPGWQKHVVARQFLPNMTVAHDYMHIDRKDALPGPAVPEIRGLYVAGEWASHGEILVDSAAASGRRAAQKLLQEFAGNKKNVREVISI